MAAIISYACMTPLSSVPSLSLIQNCEPRDLRKKYMGQKGAILGSEHSNQPDSQSLE